MNNDEKNISAAEESVETKTEAVKQQPSAPQKQNAFIKWWKNLGIGLKATIISGLALLVIIPVLLVILLGGGEGGFGGGVHGSGGKTANYSITVVTKGGMAMADLPVYIYEYEDGSLGDLLDNGYGATKENGKATFKLPKDGSYAAVIKDSIPEGYDVKDYYPLVSADMTITISSAIIPETSLVGVKYNLGDIMRDFTVTTTENKTFTLSEVLKEKKAVLINFWYTDCSWCVTEFPLMQDAYERYKDDLAIIALDPYKDDTLTDIINFKSQMGLTFDVAQDFTGLVNAFGVTGYPTSVIIDRYGVIAMIEAGAITSQRAFDVVFEHFIAEKYEQKLVVDYSDIVPKEKPNVDMPSGDDISEVFDGGLIDGIEYLPYPPTASDSEIEYSWPFIIDELEGGDKIIHPSNANKEGSYAQLVINVPMKAGEALAFDWYSSTEKSADILYVIVDGKDIYSISGESEDWSTCYAYVAKEDADYEIALVYQKDSSDNVGDDTVYLKNLRICGIDEIDNPTYIYRFAATNPDRYGEYQDYVEVFYNENDGYYHVGSVNGPLLLANLMGYTRFSQSDYVYNMSIGKDYEAALVKYCNYASNSQINGVCPVTKELKELLIKVAYDNYGDPDNEKEWLEFCCYYDSYGTDKELSDPIKGLATFSAYDTVLSNKGATDFPNEITYDRVIMPRGLFSKFTPTQSGTYLITSYAPDDKGGFIDSEAWIFTEDGLGKAEPWYTYLNIDKQNIGKTGDLANVYMMVYLEAGKNYFINIAYGDVYQEGTIRFRIERLGDEGSYRFSLASPSFFTANEDSNGGLTETISGGINVELRDGIWREKRDDGRLGSVIYVDFAGITTIFGDKPIYSADSTKMDLLKARAFDFRLSENDLYVLNTLDKFDGDVEKTKAHLRAELGDAYGNSYNDSYEGDSTEVTGFAVDEVLAGTYHGGGEDMTEFVKSYIGKIIKLGDTITVVNADGTGTESYTITEENDPRIGCVAVDEALANVLWKLMDKYTFKGVENSWLKLCYYEQYFCAATPK